VLILDFGFFNELTFGVCDAGLRESEHSGVCMKNLNKTKQFELMLSFTVSIASLVVLKTNQKQNEQKKHKSKQKTKFTVE